MSSDPRYAHLPLAAIIAIAIMAGMPLLARLQPKQEDDYWRRIRPQTYPAGGRLFYEGKPVKDAIVAFHTTVEATGYSCSALASTDDEGYFLLRTFNDAEGAAAGRHQITIQKMVPTGRIVPGTAYPGGPEFPGYPGEPEMKTALPERFADSATSGLFATVTADRANLFTIRLTEEPPPKALAAIAARARAAATEPTPPAEEAETAAEEPTAASGT
jgi:hypothetical protein